MNQVEGSRGYTARGMCILYVWLAGVYECQQFLECCNDSLIAIVGVKWCDNFFC